MTISYLWGNKALNFDKVPTELAKIYPTEEALRILGFDSEDEYGNPKRTWGPLEVLATPSLWGCGLLFSTKWRSEDIFPIPYDTFLPPKITPIVILSFIHNAWESWFSERDTPADLQLGKEFSERNLEEQLQKYLNRPSLWVDRKFFRFCVNYLDKLFDWSEEDFKIELSYASGQLKLRVEDIEVHCPARGKFNGTLTLLSSRQFFRYLAKRFVGDPILIEVIDKENVVIGSRMLPRQFQIHWSENTHPQVTNKNTIGEISKDGLDRTSIKSFPVGPFNEETYAKAKIYFKTATAEFEAAGKGGVKEFISAMIETYGDSIKPYLQRYRDDLKSIEPGTKKHKETTSNLADTPNEFVEEGEKMEKELTIEQKRADINQMTKGMTTEQKRAMMKALWPSVKKKLIAKGYKFSKGET